MPGASNLMSSLKSFQGIFLRKAGGASCIAPYSERRAYAGIQTAAVWQQSTQDERTGVLRHQ